RPIGGRRPHPSRAPRHPSHVSSPRPELMKSIVAASLVVATGAVIAPRAINSPSTTVAPQSQLYANRPQSADQVITGSANQLRGEKIGSGKQIVVITSMIFNGAQPSLSGKLSSGSVNITVRNGSPPSSPIYLKAPVTFTAENGPPQNVLISCYVLGDQPVFSEAEVEARVAKAEAEFEAKLEVVRQSIASIPDQAVQLASYNVLVADLQQELATKLADSLEEVVKTTIDARLEEALPSDESTDG
ncbi:MAG: hypothetical protein AAFY15_10240, partial [Cyanobacteria bacterium J06648_11]